MFQNILYVSLGAVAGAIARFGITHYFSQATGHRGFPAGTLMVNVLGSFAVGWVLSWTTDHGHDRWRLLAATGFCGAFTTFSAFAYESMAYWREGRLAALGLNVALNNVLSLTAVLWGAHLHGKLLR